MNARQQAAQKHLEDFAQACRAKDAAEKQARADAESALPSIVSIRDNNAAPDLMLVGQGWNGFFMAFADTYSPERFKRQAAEAIIAARELRLWRERGIWTRGMERHAGGAIAAKLRKAGDRRITAMTIMQNEIAIAAAK